MLKSDKAASPPSPKASRARCLRLAPRRPRWLSRSSAPTLHGLGRLSTLGAGPLGPEAPGWAPATEAARGPGHAARMPGSGAAWAAGRGKLRRISDAPTGHRIPPRVWRRSIRRPSVTGRDGRIIGRMIGTVNSPSAWFFCARSRRDRRSHGFIRRMRKADGCRSPACPANGKMLGAIRRVRTSPHRRPL